MKTGNKKRLAKEILIIFGLSGIIGLLFIAGNIVSNRLEIRIIDYQIEKRNCSRYYRWHDLKIYYNKIIPQPALHELAYKFAAKDQQAKINIDPFNTDLYFKSTYKVLKNKWVSPISKAKLYEEFFSSPL